MQNKHLRKKHAFAWMLGLSMLLSAAFPASAAVSPFAPTPVAASTGSNVAAADLSADSNVTADLPADATLADFSSDTISTADLPSGHAEENAVTVTRSDSPSGADLTMEGNLDWVQFDTKNHTDYNRKNITTPLIQNIKRETINQADERYTPTDTLYSYTDGTRNASGSSSAALVMVGNGASLEFTLPASTQTRYAKIYTGAWASDLKLTVFIGGKESATDAYSQPDPDQSGKSQVFSIQYKTETDTDEVKVRLKIEKTYGPGSYSGNASVQAVTLADRLPKEEKITTDNWNIRLKSGSITDLKVKIGGEMVSIPMNEGSHRLQWLWNGQAVALTADDTDTLSYSGDYKENGADLHFGLTYHIDEQDNLVLTASMANRGNAALSPKSASLNLGFNTYLANYPEYEQQLFPTLLRCEKTHLWGYFSSPSGKIMTVATDRPVASYTYHYQPGQHRIYGASLDLLHEGPLPKRHPQNCGSIEAGETKVWHIYLKPMADIRAYEQIKESLANATALPILDADHYTVSANEASHLTIRSGSPVTAQIVDPQGNKQAVSVKAKTDATYTCSLTLPKAGVYKFLVSNEAGYTAEAMLTCRMPWSWYLKKARQAAIDAPQKGSTHIESYIGLYSGFLARKYFPDAQADLAIDEKLNEIYPLMYNSKTGLPTVEAERIQNHSGMLGVLVDKYQASGDMDALERAVILAGHIISRQKADGGYYKGNTDYTSVIYPAKSIMELLYVEEELANDRELNETERQTWRSRYDTHFDSVTRAMDNLVNRDGALQTEGQDTFEDGANSCSYTQLSEFALFFPEGSAERKKYMDSAISYLNRHVSHQQLLVPDSRMNGGTLRFWEAQYDVEMGLTADAPNMMNSPHGWTAWSIYGYFNLYELTGNAEYLRRGMNALGSCAQLMDFDGTLRWAFVGDPYRSTNLFVYDEENSGNGKIEGKHVSTVIGEQYVNMISSWWRAPKDTLVDGYTAMNWHERQGSACDNDVHEIFKCMAEVALTKAYVTENEAGGYTAYNCTVEENGNTLTVLPAEDTVSNVSVRLNSSKQVTVSFYNGSKTKSVAAGTLPVWISTEENCTDIKQTDRNSSLSSLTVSQGTLTPAFDSAITDYTLRLHPDAKEVNVTPKAAGTNASVIFDGSVLPNGNAISIDANAQDLDQTIALRVASENLAASTVYRIRILKGSENKNIAGTASSVSAPNATGVNNDPAALIDGKKDDHTDKTTLTVTTACPQEILFAWDQPVSFDSVSLWAWYAKEQAPTSWDIAVTYDGESYTTVAKTEEAPWQYSDGHLESHTNTFETVKDAVGLKLVLHSGNTTWGHFAINEIEIMQKFPVIDTSALQKQLTAANGYRQEDYESNGWEAFLQKRTEANDVLKNSAASQKQIDDALLNLTQAMNALTKKAPVTPPEQKPNPTPDKGQQTPNPTPEQPAPSEKQPLKKGTVKLFKGIYYKVTKSSVSGGTVAVQKSKKSKKNVVIPDQITIDGITYRVTSILARAFQNDKNLTAIVLGSQVTSISNRSFYQCRKLKSVHLRGKKAVRIGQKAFTGTARKITVKVNRKISAKNLRTLKKQLKQAGISKNAVYKKVK